MSVIGSMVFVTSGGFSRSPEPSPQPDARLTKAECKRLAIMANDGLARALRPVHAPSDGDTVFAAATGRTGGTIDPFILTELGAAAADCLARAVARGVYEAQALPFAKAVPDYKTRFA